MRFHIGTSKIVNVGELEGSKLNKITLRDTYQVQGLSEKSQKIITSRLKSKDISEVFEKHSREIPDSKPNTTSRERVKLYNKNIRGSVRLRTGRFYTPEEWEERIRRIKAIKLP